MNGSSVSPASPSSDTLWARRHAVLCAPLGLAGSAGPAPGHTILFMGLWYSGNVFRYGKNQVLATRKARRRGGVPCSAEFQHLSDQPPPPKMRLTCWRKVTCQAPQVLLTTGGFQAACCSQYVPDHNNHRKYHN